MNTVFTIAAFLSFLVLASVAFISLTDLSGQLDATLLIPAIPTWILAFYFARQLIKLFK